MENINAPAFGALNKTQDYRDIPFSAAVTKEIEIPDSYKPPYLKGVFDIPNQKQIGSCGGHAVGKYSKIQDFLEKGTNPDISYRWIYAHAWQRNFKNSGYSGEGSNSRDLMWVLKNIGVGLASDFLNNDDITHAQYVDISGILPAAYDRAKAYCSGGYAYVDWTNSDELKKAIIKTGGVLIAVNVGNEWWTPSYQKQDIDPVRIPKQVISGHFIVLDSWDTTLMGDTTFSGLVFGFPNSWGPEWADGGRNEMVYESYLPFIKDAVCMTDIPNDWVQKLKDTPSFSNFKHTFSTNLSQAVLRGHYSEEVKNLQIALWIDGEFSKDVPLSEYGFYGPKTAMAVYSFQVKHNVAPMAELSELQGNFCGVKTRSKLTQLFG